jgi:hypothetical protein
MAMQTAEVEIPDKPKLPKSWNINRFHQVFNHAGDEALRRTAKAYGWKLTGKLETCQDCQLGNIRQKSVESETMTKSNIPGERVFIDTTSIKQRTLGGSKFMMGVVDDCTDFMWGKMLKRKKDQVPAMVSFLRKMASRGTPVKFIRCDNAGENKDLQTKCAKSNDLNTIQFEFTARNSPEFNGKIERKFAIIFGRIRVNYNAAGLTKKLRDKLWGEACMTAIDVENLLVSCHHDDPSYREFYKKDLPHTEHL